MGASLVIRMTRMIAPEAILGKGENRQRTTEDGKTKAESVLCRLF
jgi:hypothetical protein